MKGKTMKAPFSENNQPMKADSLIREQNEVQRRFMTLQSKRHQLEHELRTINALLLTLGNQMDQDLAYKQFHK